MADSVREFFDGLSGRVDASRTAGMSQTYLFEIDGAGVWTVVVDDGTVNVTEGDNGDADATISASEDNFLRIIKGEQNPTTAYMSGKIKIKGDMGAAMKLQKIF